MSCRWVLGSGLGDYSEVELWAAATAAAAAA